jgi:drug/metabolite transporter (DMT)-like permease
LLTVAVVGVINAAWVLPLYLSGDGPSRLAQAPISAVLLQAGYQGILTGTLAMMAFTFAIGRLGAAGAAAFTPLTPVLASVIGWWILGDAIDLPTAAGLIAVAIGVVIGGGSISRLKAR